MAMGPGVYDDLCTQVRELAHATGVAVIVFQGDKGSGFSLQGPPAMLMELPALLRQMAKDIDRDMKDADAVEAEVQRAADA